MYKPHDVDSDQYSHKRHPRDRDVTSAAELQAMSVECVAGCWSLASVTVGLVLVVPLVTWQLVALVARRRGLRRVVDCRGSGDANELDNVRQRKVVKRQIC